MSKFWHIVYTCMTTMAHIEAPLLLLFQLHFSHTMSFYSYLHCINDMIEYLKRKQRLIDNIFDKITDS